MGTAAWAVVSAVLSWWRRRSEARAAVVVPAAEPGQGGDGWWARALALGLAVVLLAVVLVGYPWARGHGELAERASWQARERALQERLESLQAQAGRVTEQEVVRYVDKVRVVRARTATIVEKVPVDVGAAADAACAVPAGFVGLHNAAAGDELPAAPDEFDGAGPEDALDAARGREALDGEPGGR